MKINEKTLVSYCVSNTPSDREGWLVKRGEVNKAFQRRWCVLRGNLLFYSERQGDREPLGVIILEGCTVELAEEETDVYAFKVGNICDRVLVTNFLLEDCVSWGWKVKWESLYSGDTDYGGLGGLDEAGGLCQL